jgi:exodeoxyribonuclease VII large subunit
MTASTFIHVDSAPGAGPPGYVRVSDVIRGVGTALRRTFPTSLWVKGEVSDYRVPGQGHHYFNLVERQEDGSQVVLPCAVWKSNWPHVRQKLLNGGIALASGQEMLFQGTVRLYDAAGKLTFHVSDVYPEFTLGQIEAQRRAVLDRLQREQLIGLNRRVELPAVPLRVAVLSSRNAAGLLDFEQVLSKSGYAFSVLRCEVPVQGPMVERSVCRALEVLALKQQELRLDVICIVRGGGTATDLGWWNSYAICAAIARMPIPVITGIGHERDRVAADEVAHATAPTPTAAAEFLCSQARNADAELREAADRMAAVVSQLLAGAGHAVEAAQQEIVHLTTASVSQEHHLIRSFREQYTANARRALAPHADAVRRLHDALLQDAGWMLRGELRAILDMRTAVATVARQDARQAGQALVATTGDFAALIERNLNTLAETREDTTAEVAAHADQVIDQKGKLLRHLSDLVRAYDPIHVLRRGFSITLNVKGKAVKSAADLAPGETIITRLAAGQIASTITQTS